MGSRTFCAAIDEAMKPQWMFWKQSLFQTALYGAVAYIILRQGGEIQPPDQIIFTALATFSVLCAGLSFKVEELILNDARLREQLSVPFNIERLSTAHGKKDPDARKLELLGQLGPVEQQAFAVVSRTFPYYFVRLALAELPGIAGLVLTIQTLHPKYFVGFGLAAVALKLVHRPNSDRILHRIAQLQESVPSHSGTLRA